MPPKRKAVLIHGIGRSTVAHVWPDEKGNLLVTDLNSAFNTRVVALMVQKGKSHNRITPRKDGYFGAQNWNKFEKVSAVLATPQPNNPPKPPTPVVSNTKKPAVVPVIQPPKPTVEIPVQKPVPAPHPTVTLNAFNQVSHREVVFPKFVEIQYENHSSRTVAVGENGEIQCVDINGCFNREVKYLIFTQGDKVFTVAPRKAGYFTMPKLDMTRSMSVSYVFGITYYELQIYVKGASKSVWAKPDENGQLYLKESQFGGKVIALDITADDGQKHLQPPIEIANGISIFNKPICGWKHCCHIVAVPYNYTPPTTVANTSGNFENFLEMYNDLDNDKDETSLAAADSGIENQVKSGDEGSFDLKSMFIGGGIAIGVLLGLRLVNKLRAI